MSNWINTGMINKKTLKRLTFFFALILLVPTNLALAQEERPIAMSSQIIVRDSEGNLIAYLNVNKVEYVSLGSLHNFLDGEFNPKTDQIISTNGPNLQMIRRSIDYTSDSDSVISNLALYSNLDGRMITLVRPIHDGIPVRQGDIITVIWTFLRAA